MDIEIRIVQGSLLDVEADVIVNAANSQGIMGGGVAGAIKRAAGLEVEQEAVRQAPIAVGQAVMTSGGRTRFRGIIHAPTMPAPAMRIPPENVGRATRAALMVAQAHGYRSVAFPGMGTGVGGVSHDDAATRMVHEIRAFAQAGASASRVLQTVLLVDLDSAMVRAWQESLCDIG